MKKFKGLSVLNPFLLEMLVLWVNFFSALALVFVLEGIMPFAFPVAWKKLLFKVITQNEKALRVTGFLSMMVGVILLSIVQQFAE